MIDPNHNKISVARQCELLNLSRSSYYYVSGKDDRYNRQLMNLIDEPVSYTHLRAHETVLDLVCRLLLETKK